MNEDKSLHILWTNSDIDTSLHMVMMYATNSMLRHWWDEVTVIIWGGTAKLVAENEMVQQKMKLAMQAGVKFSACVACASIFGVVDKLKGMDVEVIGWGQKLSEIMQQGGKVLSV